MLGIPVASIATYGSVLSILKLVRITVVLFCCFLSVEDIRTVQIYQRRRVTFALSEESALFAFGQRKMRRTDPTGGSPFGVLLSFGGMWLHMAKGQ